MTITSVFVFVDWNSQIHAASPRKDANDIEVCTRTLRHVGRSIGKALNNTDPTLRFDVTLRVYHGWYQGFKPSDRRKAMIQVFAATDFPSLSNRSNVIIRPALHFGDKLISALAIRYHSQFHCHLPNTLRKDILDKSIKQEKMVDSAIASELVDLAHREPKSWLLVMGDDDDLIPPVFVAEGARPVNSGKVLLIRRRSETPFLKLNGLSATL